MRRKIKISVCQECCICWMVIFSVKIEELLVFKVGDSFWFSTRIKLVLALFEKVLINILKEGVFGVAHCTLHFVVDDALHLQLGICVVPLLELKTVAFLSEVVVVKSREECHVTVDAKQVAEVLGVLS